MRTFTLKGPLRAIAVCAVLPALASCAHYAPRYTPDSVAPPPSLEAVPVKATPPEPAPAPPETPPPDETFTLDAVIRMALARNRELEVRSFDPEITRTAVDEARAAFDPALSATVKYGEQNTPGVDTQTGGTTTTTSGAQGGDNFTEALQAAQSLVSQLRQLATAYSGDTVMVNHANYTNADATLSQPLPTGTTLTLSGGFARSNSSALDDPEYSGTWNIGVVQSLLRGFGTDVNLVSLRRARNNDAIGGLAFRDAALQLVERVISKYWELALAQQTLEIRRFSLGLAEEQLRLNEALVSVGKLAGSARVSAQAEVAAQRAVLVDAEAGLATRSLEFRRLLNPGTAFPEDGEFPEIAVPEPDEEPFPPERSVALARAFRPDLAQARLDVANGDLAVIETKNGLLPRLDAFASYGVNSRGAGAGAWARHLDDTTYEAFEAGLNFSMTLGRRAEKARHLRAKLQAGQAEAALCNLEQLAETEVRAALVEAGRQFAQLAASRQEVAQREKELAVETEEFRLGRSTNLNVLQVQRDLVQAKLAEASARAGYYQARAGLHRAEGTLLTRHGIVLDTDREHTS